MISSEHQRQISFEQLARLRLVRAGYEATPQTDPTVQVVLLASIDTLIGDVEAELAAYARRGRDAGVRDATVRDN